MKKIFYTYIIALIFSLFAYPFYATYYSEFLTLNTSRIEDFPKSFRLTTQNSSGSSQFSTENYGKMIEDIPAEKIIIIDLREEPHGFLNGNPISWYTDKNWLFDGMSEDEIKEGELSRLRNLSLQPFTLVYYDRIFPIPYVVGSVFDEKSLVEESGQYYFRLPVKDHTRPSDDIVDKFIAFVKEVPDDYWLHFHCAAGKGRTTSFLVMYDIIKGGYQDSPEEVFKRQFQFGGADLLKTSDGWKKEHLEERVEFLREFHQYVKEHPNLDVKWSDWISNRSFSRVPK